MLHFSLESAQLNTPGITVGYMTLNGKMYRTVLKRDALGQRLYLVTLHRDGDERLNRKRKSVREVK